MVKIELPCIGIVIVNRNSQSFTLRCLAAVFASEYTNYQVIVVDNGSIDASLAAIQAAYPDLAIVKNPKNLGFTGGYNAGIRWVMAQGCEYALLLNNDAVIEPTALSALAKAARSDSAAGFLGAKICMIDDRHIILSAGGRLADGWQPILRGLGEVDRGQYDTPQQMDWLSGCALLVSRTAIERIGELDQDFFFYQEDVDWCYRGQQAGFKVLYVPAAAVWHPDTRQRDQASPLVTYYTARNSLLFVKKHRLGLKIQLRLLAGYARTFASWTLKPKWRYKHLQRAALLRAIIDFARGRYGAMDDE
jgi:GT2 family glycosyltransferase